MDIEKFRDYCLSMKGVTEDFPFDEETLVFRVGGKIFALTNINKMPLSFNLKCDPERAVELRERYEKITPGWHMNKKHWNTVEADESLDDDLIFELAGHSYSLVFRSLKKADKEGIQNS
jgi:predicted DNA-binding protein (MmcQ/YjbR family)